jgi:hypothetical protein
MLKKLAVVSFAADRDLPFGNLRIGMLENYSLVK